MIPNGYVVPLHDQQWLARQKHAGQAVRGVLRNFANTIKSKPSKLTLLDLDHQARQYIKLLDCTPSFLGYKGFPQAICTSVNEVFVHGIPTDYQLKDGDIITVDVGATFEGAIADAAFTCVYGEPKSQLIKDMIVLCQQSLDAAIKSIAVGKRLGIIGNTIFNTVKNSPFGLVVSYGGHGLDYDTPHCPPFVENKSRADDGVRFVPGMAIAIEPMLVLSKNFQTKVLNDKWSVITKYPGCHFEHSVTLDQSGNVHIITEHLMDAKDFLSTTPA